MRCVSAVHAIILSVLLALAPARTPEQEDLRQLAMRLYEEERWAEAADRFEALLAAVGEDARLRFEAGQMRSAAGHNAHAWRHFQAHAASPGLTDEDRRLGQRRLEQLAAKTRLVDVQVSPPGAVAVIVARRLGDPPGQARPDLATPITAGVAPLRLDPGAWELRIDAPGHVPLRRTIDVGDAPAPVVLHLIPAPTSPTATPPPAAVDPRKYQRARAQVVTGAVLLPIGLVALGGLVAVLPGHINTRSAFTKLRRDDPQCADVDLPALERLHTRARREEAAMLSLGLVGGALVTAGAVLLVRGQRTLQRARVALDLRPGHAVLSLSARF